MVERPLGSTDAGYGFLQYLPPDYSTTPGRHVGLLLFLPGAGESVGSCDVWTCMTRHGPGKLLLAGAQVTFDAMGQREARGGSRVFADEDVAVLMLHRPSTVDVVAINDFLTWANHSYRIDPRRIYITGLSLGGTMPYVASEGRSRIAGGLANCEARSMASGGYDAETGFDRTPIWALQAWGDTTVSRDISIQWVDGIASGLAGGPIPSVLTGYPHQGGVTTESAGVLMTALYAPNGFTWVAGRSAQGSSPLRFTLYPDDGHGVWTTAYDDQNVWDWLLSRRLPVAPEFENAVVVDDLDDGFSVVGNTWASVQPADGGFYGWEMQRAGPSPVRSAVFAGSVPSPGIYSFFVTGPGGSDFGSVFVTATSVDGGTLQATWDQRLPGVKSLGAMPVINGFSVELTSSAAASAMLADAVSVKFYAPLVEDAGVPAADGGTEVDGGTDADGGTEVDGGADADGGVGADAGVRDSGVFEDGGADVDGGHTSSPAPGAQHLLVGCGCQAGGGPGALLLFALFACRRRRHRG